MRGLIVIWIGSFASIPTGWHLCDGSEGTPNLRMKWIVGAGDAYAVDEAGGDLKHDHPLETDGHRHYLGSSPPVQVMSLGTRIYDFWTKVVKSTGITNLVYNQPPFMYVAFIMKL